MRRHMLELVLIVALVAVAAAFYRSSQPPPPDTSLELGEALRLYRGGKYPQALAWFDRLLKRDPDSLRLLTARGMTWLRMGDFERAQTDLYHAKALTDSLITRATSPWSLAPVHLAVTRLEMCQGHFQQAADEANLAQQCAMLWDGTANQALELHALARASEAWTDSDRPYSEAEAEFRQLFWSPDADQRKRAYVHMAAWLHHRGLLDQCKELKIPSSGSSAHFEPCVLCKYYQDKVQGTPAPAL